MFVNDIIQAGKKAFGEHWEESETITGFALDTFCNGLIDQEMAKYVKLQQPTSLRKAAKFADVYRECVSVQPRVMGSLYGVTTNTPSKEGETQSEGAFHSTDADAEDEAYFDALRTWTKNWRHQRKGAPGKTAKTDKPPEKDGKSSSAGPAQAGTKTDPKGRGPKKKFKCYMCEGEHKTYMCPGQKEVLTTVRRLAAMTFGDESGKVSQQENSSGPQ